MRTSLAPRLFLAASDNQKHAKQFGFFEIGKVYKKMRKTRTPS
jgi:phenylalanyl-tRNA synthetase beta subunit